MLGALGLGAGGHLLEVLQQVPGAVGLPGRPLGDGESLQELLKAGTGGPGSYGAGIVEIWESLSKGSSYIYIYIYLFGSPPPLIHFFCLYNLLRHDSLCIS